MFLIFWSIKLIFSQADFMFAEERYSFTKNFMTFEFFPTSVLFFNKISRSLILFFFYQPIYFYF